MAGLARAYQSGYVPALVDFHGCMEELAPDIFGRALAEALKNHLPKPVAVVNRRDGMGTIQVKGRRPYKLSVFIKTQKVEKFAQIQLAFLDGWGGFIQELRALPGSTSMKGTNDWSLSELEVRSPENATAVDIRCLITGQGKVWFDDLDFFEIPWE